ncbi:hypothetical protein D0T84_11705 [Dysgonomonas sp. 521]|nr:hypothetical protein [Dysgonomonas sp. 521]
MSENSLRKGKHLDKATERPSTDLVREQFTANWQAPLSKLPPRFQIFYETEDKVYWGFVDHEVFSTPVRELYYSYKDELWKSANRFSSLNAKKLSEEWIFENLPLCKDSVHIHINRVGLAEDSVRIQFDGRIMQKDSIASHDIYTFDCILDKDNQIEQFNIQTTTDTADK